MSDITAVSRALSDRAAAVAEMLLPNGKRVGREWRVGSLGGEKGESFGVCLTGDKVGVWSDFQSGEGGKDLIDLWAAVKSLTLSEALQEARNYVGMTRPVAYREPRQEYTRPPKPKCTTASGRVLDYLREDRNIPAEVIERYKIAAQGNAIVFPFLLPDGVLALAKVRDAVDGAKPKPTAPNCEPVLFGWQAIPPDARDVIITEGEIDALSWAAYGFAAMSVPFGGGGGNKQQWIENEFDRLDRFERIYLSTDMDKPGDEAADEIAKRLGRHRCLRVRLPRKDANSCRVDGFTQEQMAQILADAENLDPEGLRKASDYYDELADVFQPVEGSRPGYSTPFSKLEGKVYFRPGDLTVWTGASGAGKSQVLSHCIVHWVDQGSRVCLSSLEMRPVQTLRRMVRQVGAVENPTNEFVSEALHWLDRGLLLYEKIGKAGVDSLLEVFDYARARYGCDQFVIDSLMRLGIASDDYNGQETAVFKLVDWCVANSVHIHLVAHARKGESGGGPPATDDIKGGMEIGGNAANIISIWRNRKHEDAIQAAKTDEERDELNEKPGTILNIPKQRNGDFEGKIGLWFDQATYRYHSSFDRGLWPRQYISNGD
ncbi:AAA family ATPase [Pelagibacterium luteolum]|uniref:Twinkle protein n=1 Tax=Pelagibacterium luteolum TaxID=440168 RepID=A0A1G7ZJ73_9HYPH|nr:toprim domain-containing protein [Pelagibacterium luteolum]SDH08150.1 twinkle protein [Pelagibacterium luteolum]